MQEGDDMLTHIKHVRDLADLLNCLDVHVKDEDIVMTSRFEDHTMEFATARMMLEVSKCKETEVHGDDVALVSRQNKGGSSISRGEPKVCYNCGKLGDIAGYCFKAKKSKRDNANQAKDKEGANHAKDEDDYTLGEQACV